MKVQLNGAMYRVWWWHNQYDHPRTAPPHSAVTMCGIETGDRTAAPTTCIQVGFGAARCSVKDKFSKQAGRKIALARALKAFNKSERAAFWRKYDQEIGLAK